MSNRFVPAVLAVVLATVLQAGLAPYIAIGGTIPNLLMLVVVTLALTTGATEGAACGFAAGLMFDLLGTGPVGPMALVLTLTGYLAGMFHEQMFAEGWLLPLTVLGITALGAETAYALVLLLLGDGGPFLQGFFTKVIPGAVYNTALALLVYPWLARYLRQEQPMKTFRRLA